jgi:2-oxoglutarate dehydrogenase complex dehydrogenase (E1) component-like enzyme
LKTWLFTILGLAIFIILSLVNQLYLEKNTHQLATKLQQVEKAIESKKWHQASQRLNSLQKKWHKIKPVWSLLLHHREIDSIDQSLIRTKRAIQSHDDASAQIEQGSLAEYIKHIPKREEFSLVNIL